MDESGGSGQPRSGTDEPAEHHAGPVAPAAPSPTPADGRPTRSAEAENGTGAAGSDGRDTPHGTDPQQAPSAGPGDPHPANGPGDPHPANGSGDRHSTDGSDRSDSAAGPRGPHPADDSGRTGSADGSGGPRPAGGPGRERSVDGHTAADGRPGAQDRPTGDRSTADHTDHTAHTAGHERTLAHSGTTGTTGTTGTRPPRRPESPRGGLLMGRPFGVPVYVAPSWFLVAALITWVFGGQLDRVLPELGAARYLVSLFFAVAFYASVLVHELAHTVAALRFKLPVRRIQLQFFGGVSEIEKEAETPGREFVLAFVGPLLSLVLAGLFYVAMQPVEPGTVPGVLLAGLMVSNLIVAVFNLLPGLPLDGGRMLRAVVWKITGRPMSGTVAAAWVGRALAVSVLIGLPLLTQSGALGSTAEDSVGMDTVTDALLAAILAAIIWTGAGNSLRMARLREHLPELRARNLTRRAVPVETDTPLSEALRRANAAGARALVVVDPDGNPLSLVREAAIVGVPEHRRPWVAVGGLAQELTDGMRVSAELAGEDLLDVLRATPATEYLVVEETGAIYGVLSAADVERAFVKAMARPSP
ncbi:site-2 protease family protein [Streptomyces sp. NPDC101225]|uniref:site-2 protease family protein n=1 Tax=Streptomyces sp. NPDC101225 TaxID=3366135 RepID=UPI0037FE9CC0